MRARIVERMSLVRRRAVKFERTQMAEQRTPDELTTQQENELLCEKLLEWKRLVYTTKVMWEHPPTGVSDTPCFITWADAGLILDQFEGLAPVERVDSISYSSCAEQQMVDLAKLLRVGRLRPADIRAAALKYIKAVKS